MASSVPIQLDTPVDRSIRADPRPAASAPGAVGGLLFAATVFLSAFLLFQVQPLIGRFILPWFGGTPGVWTVCLLFFQLMLLAGYSYAHLVVLRLKPFGQAAAHAVLLAATLLLLPI